MPPTACLIDGHGCVYRAFYGIRGLSASGQPTNAVFGFLKYLLTVMKSHRPEYLAVAFDSHAPTFRHGLFDEYKSQRPPMPDDLASQLPWIHRILQALALPVFEQGGYEADDLLGSLSTILTGFNHHVVIVSGDKDMLQLVNARVSVVSPQKDGGVITERDVVKRYGVNPAQLIEVMALMGDAIDNIPGVSGIGEKTALSLVQEFGTLESLYARLHEVKNPRVKRALESSKDRAWLSRTLATIKRDLPLPVSDPPRWTLPKDLTPVFELLVSLEFHSLIKDLEMLSGVPRPSVARHVEHDQTYSMLTSLKDVKDLVARHASKADMFAVECDTGALSPLMGPLHGIRVAFDADTSYAISFVVQDPLAPASALIPEDVMKIFEPLFSNPHVEKVGRQLKTTLLSLSRLKMPCHGLAFDLELAEYLLNTRMHEEAAITPARVIAIRKEVMEALKASRVDELYRSVEVPLIPILANMEARGIAIDGVALDRYRQVLDRHLEGLEDDVHTLAGGPFNLNSPQQVGEVLFERLKLPSARKGKRGFSTAVDVLDALAPRHPVVAKLLEYRTVFKLKSGYVDALPRLMNPVTKRIHASWNQTVAATGRLSSSNPNLQNIPVKSPLGKELRKVFIPSHPTWRLVAADYSQIELRILAHMSGDPALLGAFARQEDIHAATAAEVFGVSPHAVTAEMRRQAKAINFGLMYGMSPFGLSQELHISPHQAAAYIESYFTQFANVRTFMTETLRQAKADGYVTTIMGRRRYFSDLTSANRIQREAAERAAINAPIQGSAADLAKMAMRTFSAALASTGLEAHMLLQVHDELVVECPHALLSQVAPLLQSTMESVYVLKVPLVVNVREGQTWYDASSASVERAVPS